MKVAKHFILALIGWAAATSAFAVSFIGSDNFNDNFKDPSLWGTDDISGNGALNEINSRLEFTASVAGVSDAVRPWILNYASYSSTWELRLDVFNSHVAATNEVSSFGMEVFQRGDPNDSVFVELFSVLGSKGFYSVLRANDVYAAEIDSGNLNSTFGSLRMSYDGANKIITTSYDVDGPANGFTWIPLGSFGINGSGGTTGNATWGMDDTSEFSLTVYGYSENTTMTGGMLYGDNFVAVPEPATWALLATGTGVIALCRKRRRSISNGKTQVRNE